MKKLKVILVDNNKIFRNALKYTLSIIGGNEVIGEAGNGREYLELPRLHEADLVFMDVRMPEMNGVEATVKSLELLPELKIIAFSAYENDDYVKLILKAGATGYISKNQNNYEMLKKIIRNYDHALFLSKGLEHENINEKQNLIITT